MLCLGLLCWPGSGAAQSAPGTWAVERLGSIEDPSGAFGLGSATVRFVAYGTGVGLVVPIEGNKRPGIFSVDGEARTKVGSIGEGPGEYLFINALGTHPDATAWAYDPRQSRVSRFAPDGRFLASHRCAGSVCALLSDGRRAAVSQRPLGSLNLKDNAGGFTFSLGLFTDDGVEELRSVTVRSGQIQIPQADGGVFVTMNPWGGQPQLSISPGSESLAVLVPTGRIRGDHAISEIWSLAAGDALRVTEILTPLRRITRGEVNDWVRDFMATPRRARFAPGAVEDALDPPEYAPGATDIVAMGRDQWWLQVDRSSSGQRWALVNDRGQVEGEVDLPKDMDLLLANQDRLLVLERDDFDLPRFTWLRVGPPGSGGGGGR